MSLAVYVP